MSLTKTIELHTGIDIDGTRVKRLTMREPTVGDQIDAQEVRGSQGRQEAFMVANLCGITPDEVRAMTASDYKKVQDALSDFFG